MPRQPCRMPVNAFFHFDAGKDPVLHRQSYREWLDLKTGRRLSVSGASKGRDRNDDRPGISPVDIADHNSRTALGLLRRFGPLTRQELSRHLGLTEPAITGIMRRLADAGLVSGQKRPTTAHYTAVEFSLRADAAYSLGIRLGADGGETVMMDLAGKILQQRAFTGPEGINDAVLHIRRAAGTSGKLLGCGIALATGFPLDRRAIEDTLEREVGPLFFLDDTEAAINAERMLGIGDREGGLVIIIVDETVRAGLLIGGRPFRGFHGLAGQIGDMCSGVDGASLNDVATLPSLKKHLAAHPGEPDAWVAIAARHLHEMVLAISGFIAPGAILIGGALPDDVFEAIIARLSRERDDKIRDLVIAPWIPSVRRASFPRAGVAVGAALRPFSETL
ncbi:ROK family transcriptional regulator (plasmid) [Rhizobium sullae]|uniref:ROK family transcriptional regulator n=1 Tax=Rhizobium sullae TaxID=50338 RepID=A0ABY5XTZ3_RHISU|nr:ROK family transcriptional regulator [Rhizobium sullae]UWU18092.1 ROK family transcriptional regulator [Rhizobium sullae]